MGIYLNPGNQGFRESIRSKIYVDKTNLIACTNELLNKSFETPWSADTDIFIICIQLKVSQFVGLYLII